MKQKLIFLFVFQFISLYSFSQYCLHIELEGDSCLYASFKNNSMNTIMIENPELFKGTGFGGSKYWSLIISDSEDESIKCYPANQFNNVTSSIEKWELKIKRNESYNFRIPLDMKDVKCIDPLVPENFSNSLMFSFQLKVLLIKPQNVEIESNSVQLEVKCPIELSKKVY